MVIAMRLSKGRRAVNGKLLSRLEWPYTKIVFTIKHANNYYRTITFISNPYKAFIMVSSTFRIGDPPNHQLTCFCI